MKKLIEKIILSFFGLIIFDIQAIPPALQNCGNTCFLNASIQVLYNIAPLTQLILDQPTNPYNQTQNPAPYYYTELIKQFEAIKNQINAKLFTCDPNKDLQKLTKAAYDLLGTLCGSQQDATEFLWQFQDNLLEKSISKKLNNQIKSLFSFTINTETFCPRIKDLPKYTSSRSDPYLQMTVNIKNSKEQLLSSLDECLKDYFSEEPLEEYKPEGQEKRDDCTRKFNLVTLPEILLIGLKRFDAISEIKLDHSVAIPITGLTLSNYFLDEKRKKTDAKDYELIGVIIQSGTLRAGHYWAYVKDLSNQWFKCDDANVISVSITDPAVVQEINGTPNGPTGYLLVYQQTKKRQSFIEQQQKQEAQKQMTNLYNDLTTLTSLLQNLNNQLMQ